MKFDNIKEIGIDSLDRLYIAPNKERFSKIWTSATEVHWDIDKRCLHSPKPREWSYFDWYVHIVRTVKDEYGCFLMINDDTKWVKIPLALMVKIRDHQWVDEFEGMTVNDRLFATGLFNEFYHVSVTNKVRAREILTCLKVDEGSIAFLLEED